MAYNGGNPKYGGNNNGGNKANFDLIKRAQQINASQKFNQGQPVDPSVVVKKLLSKDPAKQRVYRRDVDKHGENYANDKVLSKHAGGGDVRVSHGLRAYDDRAYFTKSHADIDDAAAPEAITDASRKLTKYVTEVTKKQRSQAKREEMIVQISEFVRTSVKTIAQLNDIVKAYGTGFFDITQQLKKLTDSVDSKQATAAVEAIKKLSESSMKKALDEFERSLGKV